MAEKNLKIWFDAEGDYLEVVFDKKPGYFRETPNDQVMEKVDDAYFPVTDEKIEKHLKGLHRGETPPLRSALRARKSRGSPLWTSRGVD